MSCDVCSTVEFASISRDWKFRANDFVMQALRYHGILPVIWCLKMLIKKHNISSFYYSPSLSLFDTDESYSENIPDAEIDLIVVIDDEVILCEIKSSNRIKDRDVQKFINLANRIRPDVAMLAIMEQKNDKSHSELMKKINGKLDSGIKFEALYLQNHHLEDWPRLPTGRQKLVRIF